MGDQRTDIMAADDIKTLFVRVPVGEDLAKATKDWKGMRVTCKLLVVNRKVSVEVIPSATALLIKALQEPPRDKKKEKEIQHDGDITFADVLAIAKQMAPRSMAKDLAGTVKEVLGTARAIGCTVDDIEPEEWTEKINEE